MFKEIYKGKLSIMIFAFPVSLVLLFMVLTKGGESLESLGGFLVIIAIYRYLKYNTTFITLYDKKVKGRVGIVRKKILDAPLDKINDIFVEYGILGRILRYGNIIIATSSSEIKFAGLSNAEEFKDRVIQQIEIYKKEQMEEQARLMAEAIKNANK